MVKSSILFTIIILIITPITNVFAEPIMITKSPGMDQVTFDGIWTHATEWKPSSLNSIETDQGIIYLRTAHQGNFVYVFLDVILDTHLDKEADKAVICFDTENDKNEFADSNDYCFIAILGENVGVVLDPDYDGIPLGQDLCPTERELYNNYQDDDGCPDLAPYDSVIDTDRDGILNAVDSCPNVKETYNRYQDEDGCPDSVIITKGFIDTDGDGIHDAKDWCPNQPETYNGILDLDGCPDDYIPLKDSDFDGVPDAIDACPEESEVYNRYQDDDGCPDSVSG